MVKTLIVITIVAIGITTVNCTDSNLNSSLPIKKPCAPLIDTIFAKHTSVRYLNFVDSAYFKILVQFGSDSAYLSYELPCETPMSLIPSCQYIDSVKIVLARGYSTHYREITEAYYIDNRIHINSFEIELEVGSEDVLIFSGEIFFDSILQVINRNEPTIEYKPIHIPESFEHETIQFITLKSDRSVVLNFESKRSYISQLELVSTRDSE